MKKKLVLLLAGILLLSGCGTKPIELTEEEAEIITEYAANTVLKYNSLYQGGLKNVSANEKIKEEESEEDDTTEVASDDSIDASDDGQEQGISKDDITIPDSTGDSDAGDGTDEQDSSGDITADSGQEDDGGITADSSQEGDSSITANSSQASDTQVQNTENVAEALGISGIEITYDSYEVMDGYVEDNHYFAVNAAPGAQLVVLELTMKNTTDEELSCDIPGTGAKFRILINGSSRVAPQVTLLQKDFARWNIPLAAGEEQKVVLITEISEEKASAVSSVDLEITRGEQVYQAGSH